VKNASYLYDRIGGSIGSLRALLGDAAIAAILEGGALVANELDHPGPAGNGERDRGGGGVTVR